MPKPVYAIIGDEPFLQIEALRAIIAQMPGDVQRVDLNGETCGLADTLDELRSYSMFGGYKLVVVRAADDFISKFRSELEDYLEKPSDAGSLVLRVDSLPKNQRIYKSITKVGEAIACEPPKAGQLVSWLLDRAKKQKIKIAPEAAEQLCDLIGGDLGRLDNELNKLALIIDSDRIEPDDVGKAVAFQREQQMWEMTDALSLGSPDEAVRRWRHLVATDPSSEFRAVTWLAIWVERAQKALVMKRQRMNGFAIAKALKIWPANNVDRLLATGEKLGSDRLNRATGQLLEIDRKNKSGLGDPSSNVEQFLLSMA